MFAVISASFLQNFSQQMPSVSGYLTSTMLLGSYCSFRKDGDVIGRRRKERRRLD